MEKTRKRAICNKAKADVFMSACLDKISFLLPITLHCCYFCFYTIFITFRPSGFLDIIRFLGLMHQPLVISFDNCLDDGQSCILVELNEEIEELVRECPEDFLPELYFKGGDDDDAILCTKSKTFKVKRVSTSNVLLFCRILDDRIEATATLGCYIELVRAQPDVGKLRQRLQDVSPFSGQDEPNGLSYDQISNFFRGSEVELNTSLEKIGAICFGNCWQLVEWGYGDRLLKYLIASIVAESWSLNKMPCPIIHRILKDCGATDQIISWVISRFFEPLEPKLVAISELKIARFEAEYILQSAPEKYLVLDTFLELWRKAVHSSLNIDLEMLKVWIYL